MDHAPIYVLVVEDGEEDAQFARAALERAGMRVTVAASMAAARKALEQGSYEVLLIDLRLPDGDGLDLLTTAREKDPHSVGIVLTGFASTQTAVGALRRGAYEFLTKPCDFEVLAAAVRRGAEKHRLSRALAQRTAELESLNKELDKRVQESTREIFFLNERLKRFIVQIMESNEQRTKFMDNVTHELKNPLSVIWGHATFLLGREITEWSPQELALSLKAILRNADGLNALLEELTDSARLSSQKIRLNREQLHAFQEVHDIVESFRPQAESKGVTLLSTCGEGKGPSFPGDKHRLRQILSNLITNALKFTPEGGRIDVGAAPSGSSVHFSVSDSGPGIPPEALARIFDRFFQVDTKHKHKGLGLGLEISKGLVTLHGGTIWAESEVGKGTKFHFTIPCVAPDGVEESPLPRIGRPH